MTEEQACLRVGINQCSFRTARSRNPEYESAIKQAQADFLDQAIDTIAKVGVVGRALRGYLNVVMAISSVATRA